MSQIGVELFSVLLDLPPPFDTISLYTFAEWVLHLYRTVSLCRHDIDSNDRLKRSHTLCITAHAFKGVMSNFCEHRTHRNPSDAMPVLLRCDTCKVGILLSRYGKLRVAHLATELPRDVLVRSSAKLCRMTRMVNLHCTNHVNACLGSVHNTL